MTLKLVKDFQDYQFVYFWIDQDEQAVSPTLPTLEHAKEWFTDQHFRTYEGKERRRRKVDRRNEASSDNTNNAEVPFSRRVPSKTRWR